MYSGAIKVTWAHLLLDRAVRSGWTINSNLVFAEPG